jgi:hypothetical protein
MGMATITDTPTMATDTTDIIRAITRDTEKAQPIRVLSDICAHHAPRPVVGVSLALDECRRFSPAGSLYPHCWRRYAPRNGTLARITDHGRGFAAGILTPPAVRSHRALLLISVPGRDR